MAGRYAVFRAEISYYYEYAVMRELGLLHAFKADICI